MKKIAARSLHASRKRNGFVITAVLIITFLLTLVLSAGNIFVSAQRQESLRLVGTTAEASLRNPTAEQKNILNQSQLVNHLGLEFRLGTVQNTGNRIGISYIDQTEWECHRLSLVGNFEGRYPEAEKEIIAARWILDDIGIVEPELGMVVPVTYFDKDNRECSYEFILSGYFQDDSYVRSAGRGNIYVSLNYAMWEDKISETFYMDLDGNNKESISQKLTKELNLQSGQYLSLSPVYEGTQRDAWITIGFLTGIIVLSGYLFIYSFFYLSISKDIKMYGELITIGATKTQIKQIMYRQIRLLLLRGTLIGAIAGFLGAYIVLPLYVNIFFEGQISIDLSGVILGTTAAMVLSALTVFISCSKPVRMLSTMQPINTIHYENYSHIKYRKICGIKNNVFHMAWRNLWRRRKNACMIIFSFTVGCTAFLSISLFYESINPRQYVDRYYQYDIEVTDESEAGTNITKGILTQVKEMTGIEKLDMVERQFIFVEYEADIFQEYLADFQEKIKLDVDGLEPNIMSEQFWSYAYILPDEYMSQKEPGTVYISEEYMEMFPLGTKFNIKNAQGTACIVPVAGYIEEEDDLPKGGMAPVIYLSETGRNYLGGEWNTFQIGIMCSTAQDGEVLKQLNTILPTGGIKIESKAEWEKKLSDNMSIFYLMLGGLALFLLFNSVLNFINTMSSNIQERNSEFKTLSNVGMTKKQIHAMLIQEGAIYTVIITSLVTLISCIGAKILFGGISGIAPYAEFHFPVLQLLFIVGIIGIICMSIPRFVYKIVITS